jgi:O-antigen ligase
VPRYLEKFPLGAGLGSVGPAVSVPGAGQWSGKVNGESQATMLIVEVGIPGLLLLVGFHGLLIWLVFKRVKRIEDHDARILLAAAGAPLVALAIASFVGPSTLNTPNSPYFWFVGGVLAWWLIGRQREERRNRHPAVAA